MKAFGKTNIRRIFVIFCLVTTSLLIIAYADWNPLNPFSQVEHYSQQKFSGSLFDISSGSYVTRNDSTLSTSVALGMGITSRHIPNTGFSLRNLEFFSGFLPSFCETASQGYTYYMYIAYDWDDPKFTTLTFLQNFRQEFNQTISNICAKRNITASLRPVQCKHSKKPAWAQNDAMMRAYLDGCEYFYRINDDTKMVTSGWTERFIQKLTSYQPQNVGVVGPAHEGGHLGILTYDFVHRTHVDIFGFYYPRRFIDWSADNWITNVYMPGRSKKMTGVKLVHTMRSGRRYDYHAVSEDDKIKQRIKDQTTLNRYLKTVQSNDAGISSEQRSDKIIALSLNDKNWETVWGAIRNAQLAPVIFPGWRLRFYVPFPYSNKSSDPPLKIMQLIQRLGAEIHPVNFPTSNPEITPELLSLYVLHDDNAEYFLIRNSTSRLCERDRQAVEEWMSGNTCKDSAAFCLRDHPLHGIEPVTQGLWGGKLSSVKQLLGDELQKMLPPESGNILRWIRQSDKNDKTVNFKSENGSDLMLNNSQPNTESNYSFTSIALNTISNNISSVSSIINSDSRQDKSLLLRIWTFLQSQSCCFDSVTCSRWPGSKKFSTVRSDAQPYIGQPYSADEEPEWDFGMSKQAKECL